MRKALVVIALLVLLSVAVIGALYPEYTSSLNRNHPYGQGGVQRVTNYDPRINFQRIDANVYLNPPGTTYFAGAGRGGYAPMYPRGVASIRSSTWYGYPRAQVTLTTKDLEESSTIDSVYEAWLVDLETGQRLSLGIFTTVFGGTGELIYNIDNYFDAYDLVEVTVEPANDQDVLPGPVALVGRMPAPTHFNPAPKSAKMVTRTFTVY